MLDLINELKEELKGDQDKLTALLDIENEIREKKYGLVWEEHEEAVDKELETKIPVFKEDKDREIKLGDEKVNFILEGDNLHSLYLLEKTHRGKIDVIYIDPPYNTGKNDFKYGDKMIGEDDGYRHSKWLSFMSKRLEIARELLTDEGVIFISIDDNEQANLKLLCDEIFGEKNFIANFIWEKNLSPSNLSKTIRSATEYVICYGKNTQNIELVEEVKEKLDDSSLYNKTNSEKILEFDKDAVIINLPDGVYKRKKFNTTELMNTIVVKNKKADKNIKIKSRFIWLQDTLDAKIKEGYQILIKSDKFVPRAIKKGRMTKVKPSTLLEGNKVGTTLNSNSEIRDLFGDSIFDYTKPCKLIKYLVNLIGNKNALILDFFAGSGTTGQAVLELNQEDGGNRTFILCTNNEVGEKKEKEFKKKYGNKEDYPEEWLEWEEKYGIARSITYERMRKVIEGYTTPKGKEIEGISANLKYYKTDYIEKENPEDDDYEIEEEILKYVIELIQLEYGIDISNKEIGLILSDMYGNLDEEYNVSKITEDRLDEIKVLYVAEGLLLPDNLEDELKERGIEIKWVPRYYNFN